MKRVRRTMRLVSFFAIFLLNTFDQPYQINHSKILDFLRYGHEDFILNHACGVLITAKSNDHYAVLFGNNGLVDLPTAVQVRKQVGHGGSC